MRSIFCGNLEHDTRQSDLERMFKRYGKVDRVEMKSGFAFIYMEDERDAEDAIRALDRVEFGRQGRRLRVEWTKHERDNRRPGSSRRSSANSRPSKTLFVINFDTYQTRTRDLERHFEPYGKIVNVRIRRNFAFVQYESLDDAIRALEATNMSKLLDRVITVEFAADYDDDRRNARSPDRSHVRSRDTGYDRKRSHSPYRRERDSPDYGRGGSNSYRKERSSPDYGHDRGQSSQQFESGGRDYSDRRRSPYRRERDGSDPVHGSSHSPDHEEQAATDCGNSQSHSPEGRERVSPRDGGSGQSPSHMKRASSENGHGSMSSPDARGDSSPYNGDEDRINFAPEPKDDADHDAPESPMDETYRSQSPAAEE